MTKDAKEAGPTEGPASSSKKPAKPKAKPEETNHKVTYKVGKSKLELQLPPKLRASVEFRIRVLRDGDDEAAIRLMQAVVGAAQFEAVMDQMDVEELSVGDEVVMTSVGNLLNDALAVYGLQPGESEASPKS